MVPTCIDDDKAAAAAVNRRTLTSYVRLPNYQNYWIEAGFEEEMQAIRQAIADKEDAKIPALMSDRWLQQVTLYGSAAEVREGDRGLVRDWHQHADRCALVDAWGTDGGVSGAYRRLALRQVRRQGPGAYLCAPACRDETFLEAEQLPGLYRAEAFGMLLKQCYRAPGVSPPWGL